MALSVLVGRPEGRSTVAIEKDPDAKEREWQLRCQLVLERLLKARKAVARWKIMEGTTFAYA